MKAHNLYSVLILICLIPFVTTAKNKWNTPDKGYFKYQKDLDNSVSYYTYSSATIFYNGELFNFMHYYKGVCKIIVRRIKADNINTDTDEISWSAEKQDDDQNLNSGIEAIDVQPAPVVFESNLLLFMELSDHSIGYSKYNPNNNTWDKYITGPSGCIGDFMSAIVVEDKLVLIAKEKSTGNVTINWTKNLKDWQSFRTSITIGTYKYTHDMGVYDHDYKISAISKSYIKNQSLCSKIMISYIPADQSVKVAEFEFDDNDNISLISDNLVANECTYSSATLAEGTVKGDASTGVCTQIFLKKDTKDNGYCRYRIFRYQKIEGQSWNKRENNLVPQNYLWADNNINLTTANFSYVGTVNGKEIIKQKMCLVYRGYDDWDHPLNLACATTDYLKYIDHKTKTLYENPYLQFIGYIEGAPPFYLNEPSKAYPHSPYLTGGGAHISETLYKQSKEYTVGKALSFEVEGSVKLKLAGFSAAYSQAKGRENETTTKNTISIESSVPAQEDAQGRYLCLAPTIIMNRYVLYDWKGDSLFNTYDIKLMLIDHTVDVPLGHGFKYGNLDSYFDGSTDYLSFDRFNKTEYPPSISWLSEGEKKATIAVEEEATITTKKTKSVKLGLELGELFGINLKVKGGFEYTLSTTTTSGNEISCVTNLNEAIRDSDIYKFDYTIWWLKKTPEMNNWWLHPEQDKEENTWCITYEVTGYKRVNGISVPKEYKSANLSFFDNQQFTTNIKGNKQLADLSIRNRPNPFSSNTIISYTIGNESFFDQNNLQKHTTVSVYNSMGKLVTNLVNEIKSPGTYEVQWDASSLPAGIYMCKLLNGNQSAVCKMVVNK